MPVPRLQRAVCLLTAACIALPLAAAVAVVGGCGAPRRAGPNVGTYTFLSGEFSGCVIGPLDRVVAAAEAALKKSGLMPSVRRSENSADLRVQRSDGRDVWVRLKREGDTQCCVCIVIGAVGDEERSAALFQAIRSGL